MSFSTALVLSGVGAFFYKYDQDQQYQIHPECDSVLNEYDSKRLYQSKLSSISTRVANILQNFFSDFFLNSPFLYPFKGIKELVMNRDNYVHTALGTFALYLLSFSSILVTYWVTIAPIMLTFLAILGPLGLTVTAIHSFLHANMLAMLFLRLSHSSNTLVYRTLRNHNFVKIKKSSPTRFYVPISTKYFWAFHLPLKLIKYSIISLYFTIALVTSFIPLLGPFLFNAMLSPFITKIYFSKILRYQNLDNLQRNEMFYNRLGFFVSFGLTAALLESIPILSGFVISTNSISTSLWTMNN